MACPNIFLGRKDIELVFDVLEILEGMKECSFPGKLAATILEIIVEIPFLFFEAVEGG